MHHVIDPLQLVARRDPLRLHRVAAQQDVARVRVQHGLSRRLVLQVEVAERVLLRNGIQQRHAPVVERFQLEQVVQRGDIPERRVRVVDLQPRAEGKRQPLVGMLEIVHEPPAHAPIRTEGALPCLRAHKFIEAVPRPQLAHEHHPVGVRYRPVRGHIPLAVHLD